MIEAVSPSFNSPSSYGISIPRIAEEEKKIEKLKILQSASNSQKSAAASR